MALRNFSQQENENASSSESSSKIDIEPIVPTVADEDQAVDNDPMMSPVGTEFVSDSGELPDALDADLETARQMLGILDTSMQISNGKSFFLFDSC